MVRLPTPLPLSLGFLVAANLLPLAGVVFLGWKVFDLLMLFWIENVVIGVLNVCRMGTLLLRKGELLMLFLIPFFTVHYGAFCAGHGLFIYSMFGPGAAQAGMLDVLRAYVEDETRLAPVLALAASHAVSFIVNFLGRREYERIDPKQLMHLPYVRIVILHVTIVVGGIVALSLGEPVYALALLVALKIAFDGYAHVREHRRLAAPPSSAQRAD